MLLPLTLLLVLRISAVSPAAFFSPDRFYLTGVRFKHYLRQIDDYDDYGDYKQEEIKEEDYQDYETILTIPQDVTNHGPLQPNDNEDKDDPLKPDTEDYDGSIENNTVHSMNQTYYSQSDAEISIFNYSDYGTSQFYSDWVNYNTSWDQYNESDWEYNRIYWAENTQDSEYNTTSRNDLMLTNVSDWLEENNDTTGESVYQTGTEKYPPHSQPVGQGQDYHHRGQGQIVSPSQGRHLQSSEGQFKTSGRGQIVMSGQGQRSQSGQGKIGTSGLGHNVQNVTRSRGQLPKSGLVKNLLSDQGQYSQSDHFKRRKPNRNITDITKSEELVPVNKRPITSERPVPVSQNSETKVREKPNARKCCPMGEGYDMEKGNCTKVSTPFQTTVWLGNFAAKMVNPALWYRFKAELPDCSQGPHSRVKRVQVTDVSQVYYMTEDGNLVVEFPRDRNSTVTYTPPGYCVDDFVNNHTTNFDAFICYEEPKNYIHTTLSSVCMLVTCFLILLRVIVFAFLSELRTLHGMILMAYLISFLVGFMLLSITQLLFELEVIVQDVCTFCSFIIYFSILSAFFWRNIMCYDIWWTFRGKRAFSSRGFSSRSRFNLYSAYAFGVPMALSLLLGALEFLTLPSSHPLMPKLRLQGCFLYGYSKLLYLYGPIILLFIINVILSTLTAVKIAAIKKETKTVLQSNESSTHDLQRATQRFSLYLKLFTAMAFLEVNWILEVVAVFAPDVTNLLHLSDFYNVIAPLIIFINFMCQKQTWKIIKKRYRQMKGLPHSGVPTSGTQTTQSQDDTESQIKQV